MLFLNTHEEEKEAANVSEEQKRRRRRVERIRDNGAASKKELVLKIK